MAAEFDNSDEKPVNASTDTELTENQLFYRELMNELDRRFPNAFVKIETEDGEPVWSIHQPFHFDPIDLKAGTEWFITEDGILGSNEMVKNYRRLNPRMVLSEFREQRTQAVSYRVEPTTPFYSVGQRDNQGYSPLVIFEPREADQQTLEDFGAYLQQAEITGQRNRRVEAAQPQRLGLDDVLKHVVSSSIGK